MKQRVIGVVTALLLSTGLHAVAAQAQSVRGTVVDMSGLPLPGVTVTLTAGGRPRETTTDANGAFTFAAVPDGEARLHFELSGFLPADMTAVVGGEQPASISVRLKVGFAEEVTVSGDATSVLSPAQNASAVEFDPESLRRLPIDAQDLQSLVDAFTSGSAAPSSVVIDGVETNTLGIPVSAVHRLTINRNPYAAEFKAPGTSRVEVETERGSRRFYHGSVGIFARNSVLEARNAFALSDPEMTRAVSEMTLGGPLPRKSWSFFASAQRLADDDVAIVRAMLPAGLFVRNAPTAERRAIVSTRSDLRPNKTDALTLRYDLFSDDDRNRGVGGFKLAEQAFTTRERRHRIQVGDHRASDGGLLNDTRVEFTSSDRDDGSMPGAPSIVVSGAFAGGPSQTFTVRNAKAVMVQDTATMTLVGRMLRIGARAKPEWYDLTDGTNFGGTYTFRTLSDFVAGRPITFARRFGNPHASYVDADGAAFAETDFRPWSTLSVTAGVRYDWEARVADWNNVAPRIAAAFAPADRRTVFRAGVGRFYQSLPDRAFARALTFGSDGVVERAVASPAYPNPPSLASNSRLAASWRLADDVRLPSTVQVGGAAERAVARRTWLAIEYTHLQTSNVLRARDVNAPVPSTGRRPDPSRLNVFEFASVGETRSDALAVTLRSKMSGFHGTAQYTIGRTTDDGSDVLALPADSTNLAAERGRADFDRLQRLNVSGTYGWRRDRVRLGAVFMAWSGAPFDIVTGADDNHDLVLTDRPAGLTRNTGGGPAFAQMDVRFTTALRALRPPSADPESLKREQVDNLELAFDVFNAFDRVNPTTYVGVITSPLFGRANAAHRARTAQLSIRYRF
jgi:carboxypeptidase family protein/TonB-dependent receptor-like protein